LNGNKFTDTRELDEGIIDHLDLSDQSSLAVPQACRVDRSAAYSGTLPKKK
jgi:hypothetical protein